MRTKTDVEDRVAQIRGIPQHSGRYVSAEHAAIRDGVTAYVERKLGEDVVDFDALWDVMSDAMHAHRQVPALPWSAPKEKAVKPKGEPVAVDPSPAVISPRTGKPKRKYTRRKKA